MTLKVWLDVFLTKIYRKSNPIWKREKQMIDPPNQFHIKLTMHRVFWIENKVDSWKQLSKYSAFLCKKPGKIDHDLLEGRFNFFVLILVIQLKIKNGITSPMRFHNFTLFVVFSIFTVDSLHWGNPLWKERGQQIT